MVGGTGTLDEATEILELKKHGHTDKPVVPLNTADFDGLRTQFRRMDDEGFLPRPLTDLVFFAGSRWGAGLPGGEHGRTVMRAWRAWLPM